MASRNGNGFQIPVGLQLDKEASQRMEEEAQASAARAGKAVGAALTGEAAQTGRNAARELTKPLTEEYNRAITEAKVALGKGLIDKRQFAEIRTEADRTFNKGLTAGMTKLRAEGKLTEGEFQTLARRIKTVGDGGPGEFRKVESAVGRLKGAVMGLLAPLIAVFALDRIRRFGQEAFKAGLEVVEGQARLRASVENAGLAWETAEGQIRSATSALWDTHRLTGGEIDAILQRLIAKTNDYAGSLERVGLVADVAKGLQIDQAAAADLVARAMTGQVSALSRLGIQAKDSADALRILETRFSGMAKESTTASEAFGKAWGDLKEEIGLAMIEADGGVSVTETLTGSIRGLTRWIADNGEAIQFWAGGALTIAVGLLTGLARVVGVVTNAVLGLGGAIVSGLVRPFQWVVDGAAVAQEMLGRFWRIVGNEEGARAVEASARRNRELAASIRAIADAASAYAKENFRDVADIVSNTSDPTGARPSSPTRRVPTVLEDAEEAGADAAAKTARDALREEIAQLKRAADLKALSREELLRIWELQDKLNEQLQDASTEREHQLEILEQLRALDSIDGGDRPKAQIATLEREIELRKLSASEEARLAELERDRQDRYATFGTVLQARAQEIGAHFVAISDSISGAFERGFGLILEQGANLATGAKAVAKGIAGAFIGGLAQLARPKAVENALLSAEEVAKGLAASASILLAPTAPAHFAAAAKHAVVSAGWGALGGVAGAAASAVSGGGGGGSQRVPHSGRDPGLSTAQAAAPAAPDVHLHLIGPGFHALNPEVLKVVHGAQEYAKELFGDGATIHYGG